MIVEMSVKRLLVHPRIRCGGAQIGLFRQIGNSYPRGTECDSGPGWKLLRFPGIRIEISPAFVLFALLLGERLIHFSGDMNNRRALDAARLGGRSGFRSALCPAAAGRRESTRIGWRSRSGVFRWVPILSDPACFGERAEFS